jgi:uncharacterized Zn-finger protein
MLRLKRYIPKGSKIVQLIAGIDYDKKNAPIKVAFPKTTNFLIAIVKKTSTNRHSKLLKCESEGCDLFFKKWHNFFDHLRTHTGEKPYRCTFKGCEIGFSQKTNMNKHMKIHTNFVCSSEDTDLSICDEPSRYEPRLRF